MPTVHTPKAGRFFETYTRDLTSTEFQRLFTREAVDAYRFFARGLDMDALSRLPWHKRALEHVRLLFLAFTLRLSPARRAVYGIALAATVFGLLQLFRGFEFTGIGFPVPTWQSGAIALLVGVLMMNLLVLLEVADRLSLKNDLDIAREIQQAMLPCGVYQTHDCEAYGQTRPANTVGGDFYEILPLDDGRVVVAVGDVAGKGSPAALLMALLLAMLRTLLDEGLEERQLLERLNAQICKHAPRSRFITLFFGVFDPPTGRLVYINAGQNPPFIRRRTGEHDRLSTGGIALGMFEGARYDKGVTLIEPGEVLVLYSDGITEAESRDGEPFDESGLERVVDVYAHTRPTEIAAAVFQAVATHADASRFADDLTLVVLRRAWPSPEESLPPLP